MHHGIWRAFRSPKSSHCVAIEVFHHLIKVADVLVKLLAGYLSAALPASSADATASARMQVR